MMSKKPKILVLENKPSDFKVLNKLFSNVFDLEWVNNIGYFWNKIETENFVLIFFDLNIDNDSDEDKYFIKGLKNLKEVREKYPSIPIIVFSKSYKTEFVVDAIKIFGAQDYFCKGDYNPKQWLKKVNLIVKTYQLRNVRNNGKSQFIGNSKALIDIKKRLKFYGQKPNRTLLITGENGVGKEVAVDFFYQNSLRNNKPFIVVNLLAIPKELLESALFGYEKGTFTGAAEAKIGYIEAANGGVLFLDEIGEIDEKTQIKLLRFLENKTIQKIGINHPLTIDVQIISATNKNLEKKIKEKKFRKDLYHRISRTKLHIPSLRERKEDLPKLIAYFLNIKENQIKDYLTDEAYQKLIAYSYPGNIRELKNYIDHAVDEREIIEKEIIDLECLPKNIKEFDATKIALSEIQKSHQHLSHDEQIDLAWLIRIENTLSASHNNKTITANKLNLNRDKLRYKLKMIRLRHPHLLERFSIINKLYFKPTN